MTRFRKCLLSVTLLSTFALAQPSLKPKDIDGWGKVKWGMTADQLRVAYQGEIREEINFQGKLIAFRLSTVNIGDTAIEPVISLSGEGKVQKLDLTKLFTSPGRDQAYDAIKAMLISKYGPPVSDDRHSDGNRSAQWLFPSTRIVLDTFGTVGLEVIYKPAAKNIL